MYEKRCSPWKSADHLNASSRQSPRRPPHSHTRPDLPPERRARELVEQVAALSNTAAGEIQSSKLLLPIDEAADLLGILRTRLYELVNNGDLMSCRIGSRRYIKRSDIDSFVDSLSADVTSAIRKNMLMALGEGRASTSMKKPRPGMAGCPWASERAASESEGMSLAARGPAQPSATYTWRNRRENMWKRCTARSLTPYPQPAPARLRTFVGL